MKMEAKRKEATRYTTDRVTGRVVEKELGNPTIKAIEEVSDRGKIPRAGERIACATFCIFVSAPSLIRAVD